MMKPNSELIEALNTAPKPKVEMPTSCAWCQPKANTKSHGICESCRERVLVQS